MIDEKGIRLLLFVFRCCGAAIGALAIATAIGLPFPVWSAMSALIVSQDRLNDTKYSLMGRILGTVLGIGVACLVNLFLAPYDASHYLQLALSVGFCAVLAHRFPQLRVSMWTCPLVLLTAHPPTSIIWSGFIEARRSFLVPWWAARYTQRASGY